MTPTDSLSARLKAATDDLHTRAERHPVQRALVTGSASAEAYAAYLVEMLWVHDALEPRLQLAAARSPFLRNLLRDHHFRLGHLHDDLAHFGHALPPAAEPCRATKRFRDWIAETADAAPDALAGILYVLEGSTNGGQFIARSVRRGLNLEGARGTRYLDPHGAEQKTRWSEFKRALDTPPLNAPDSGPMIAAAAATFAGLIEIFDELATPLPAAG